MATDGARLLVSPEFDGVTEEWFDPEAWGASAVPVDAGGRGGAWFLRSGASELVLRHYRRGGFAGKFVERTYLYSGAPRTRSFAEFHLTRELHQAGLPVPRVVAAIIWPRGWLWYHAAIIVERIPAAVNFPDSPSVGDESLWFRVGQMVRRFHDWGLDHVDLNCDNILVAGDDIYLIDFDRCRRRSLSSSNRWREHNLQRLKRSVDKRIGPKGDIRTESLWQRLLSGYHDACGCGSRN